MSHLGPHLNIVNLLGACTKHGEPLLNHQGAPSSMAFRDRQRFLLQNLAKKSTVGKMSLSSLDVTSGSCGLVSEMVEWVRSRMSQTLAVHQSGVLRQHNEWVNSLQICRKVLVH